jgi:arabinogalactan oligomer/maltooligosaccharide transport system permease protein
MSSEFSKKASKLAKFRRLSGNTIVYIILVALSIIWLIPILWIVFSAFRGEAGSFSAKFIPDSFTFQNFIDLWNNPVYPFRIWFFNTFIVAISTCIISTALTLMISYVLSRMRFRFRKPYMNVALILGMFPAFMSMIAVYYVLKAVNLTQSLTALVLVYSAGAGINYYICKGFFDTVPRALDEAAKLDGATNFQIFIKIIMPMSGPIIVYQALMSFMAPWADFIFARIIMGDNYEKYTVAIGMYQMIAKENIFNYFRQFNAGCILIGIPLVVMFVMMQKLYVEGVTGGAVKS